MSPHVASHFGSGLIQWRESFRLKLPREICDTVTDAGFQEISAAGNDDRGPHAREWTFLCPGRLEGQTQDDLMRLIFHNHNQIVVRKLLSLFVNHALCVEECRGAVRQQRALCVERDALIWQPDIKKILRHFACPWPARLVATRRRLDKRNERFEQPDDD